MKKITSLIAFGLIFANIFAFSAVAQAKEKAPKKVPEFGISSVKQMTDEIAEINTAENFITIGKGKNPKKVLTTGTVIIKATETSTQTGTLADLVKGEKVHLWVSKKPGGNKTIQALIITQFLGAKALASQPPVAQFTLSSSQGLENATPSLAVSLSKATTGDVKISYTVSGTASGTTDYSLANGNLIIAAGQTTGIIPLIIANDTVQESEETVIVTLTAVTGATLGAQKIHTYTIKDDDQATGTVGFSTTSSSGAENVSSASFPVTLSVAATQPVLIDYTVSGTATGGGTDFSLSNGTATISAGQTTTNIIANIVDDTTIESAETIIVTLSNPRGATFTSSIVYTYTITDNDNANIGFGSANSAGSEATTSMSIPVTLSTVSTKEAKVNYAVTGTATGSGTDYTLANGTLTIPAGQTTANIAFTIVNDTLDEIDETVILTLSAPIDATLGATAVHTYTIQDNDNPTVQFSSATGSGLESVTPVSIAIAVSAAPAEQVQVTYTVTGTATGGGTDYTLANGTATIAVGQTTTNIPLIIVEDALVDAAETVIVTLSSPTNSTLGSTTVYTYTITDND
ncbi:MAG: Calx-beta domain-containing protein [Patescibacteria group bacterium]